MIDQTRVNEENGPPLQAALAEQLGFKLEESRVRVEVPVIDRIERPEPAIAGKLPRITTAAVTNPRFMSFYGKGRRGVG